MSTELALQHNKEALRAPDADSKLQHLEKAMDELARAVRLVELDQRNLHEKLENVAMLIAPHPADR